MSRCQPNRFRLPSACLALCLFGPHAALAGVFASAEFGLMYEDNVNNSIDRDSALNDSGLIAGAGAGRSWLIADSGLLRVQGQLERQQYFDFSGLTHTRIGASGHYRYRAGARLYSPTLGLDGRVTRLQYNSRLREGWEFEVAALGEQFVTTRISARGTAAVEVRRADRDDVFQWVARSLALDLDWTPQEALAIYVGYLFRHGDFVTSGMAIPLMDTRAREEDDAFRDDDQVLFANRLSGRTHVGHLGFNRGLGPRLAVDGQVRYVQARVGAARYERWHALLSLLARF